MKKKKTAKNRRFVSPPKSVIILKFVLHFFGEKLFSCEKRINKQTIRKKERKRNRKTERGRERKGEKEKRRGREGGERGKSCLHSRVAPTIF